MNYYKRYMGDYGRDTGTLSLAEHGAYALLMDHYYGTEEPLPAAYDDLYRICRAMKKDEQVAVKKVADKFFPLLEDGRRHNARVDEELAKYHERANQNRLNGKSGGRPRTNRTGIPKITQSVSGWDCEMVSEIEPKKNLKPEARNQKFLRGYSGGEV
jgi:uncharacterized protein YdaU (DUF1376 family)